MFNTVKQHFQMYYAHTHEERPLCKNIDLKLTDIYFEWVHSTRSFFLSFTHSWYQCCHSIYQIRFIKRYSKKILFTLKTLFLDENPCKENVKRIPTYSTLYLLLCYDPFFCSRHFIKCSCDF